MLDKKQKEKFLELIAREKESLLRYAKSICRNYEDARDIVSETTLRAYESFDKVENHISFKSYLFTIASRLHYRKSWRDRIFFKFKNREDWNSFEENLATTERSDLNHDIALLREMIARLPEKQKEALVLFEINGFSLEEIREIQGGTISGVKTRLHRARATLSDYFREENNVQTEKKIKIENNSSQVSELKLNPLYSKAE
jgi:RNA polymerase sigma-70 factor (ECF subfamily)